MFLNWASLPIIIIVRKDYGERYASLWKYLIGCLLTVVIMSWRFTLSDLALLLCILCTSFLLWIKNQLRIFKEKRIGEYCESSYNIGIPRFFSNTPKGMYLSAITPILVGFGLLFLGLEYIPFYFMWACAYSILEIFLVYRREGIRLLDQQDAIVRSKELQVSSYSRNTTRRQSDDIQEKLVQLFRKE